MIIFEKKGIGMETKILKIDRENIDIEKIKEAASYIKNGDLVGMPTETVYGLGVNGLCPECVKKVFEAKGRPQDNPLILHISHIKDIDGLCRDIKKRDYEIMEKLWPGPLTLIFYKKDIVPDIVSGGGDTVGIRLPENPIARKLIEYSGVPIAAPSANLSGSPSPTNARDVYSDMNGRIRAIIDGGSSDIGIESTVIDMTGERPVILRPGFYTLEYLKTLMGDISLDKGLTKGIPKSPGQKYKHYAPKAELFVYVGDIEKVREKILGEIGRKKEEGLRVGVMTFDEDITYDVDLDLRLGPISDIRKMGQVLFKNLREFDRNKIDIIFGVGVMEEGYGTSIMNRLKKASSGRIIYVD